MARGQEILKLPLIFALTGPRDGVVLPAVEVVDCLIGAGVELIQLRERAGTDAERLTTAVACVARAAAAGAALIVKSRCDLAILSAAMGVHLDDGDVPPQAARRLLGKDAWIGGGARTIDTCLSMMDLPDLDYVALGPVFPRAMRETSSPPVGIAAIERVSARKARPLVVGGGVIPEAVGACLSAGADCVAMSFGLLDGDPRANFEVAMESAARAGFVPGRQILS